MGRKCLQHKLPLINSSRTTVFLRSIIAHTPQNLERIVFQIIIINNHFILSPIRFARNYRSPFQHFRKQRKSIFSLSYTFFTINVNLCLSSIITLKVLLYYGIKFHFFHFSFSPMLSFPAPSSAHSGFQMIFISLSGKIQISLTKTFKTSRVSHESSAVL